VTKTGRNEPCPCGSGKKYKRCCGSPENLEREALRDGSPSVSPEEYEAAFDLVADFLDDFMMSGKEAGILGEQLAWFDTLYEPGAEGGVPEGLLLPWLCFDLPFGKPERTLCERFMGTPEFSALAPGTAEAVRRLSVSYPAFYRTIAQGACWLSCRELGTGREWRVTAMDAEDLDLSVKGEVQYMRLAGPPGDAWLVDAPWLLDDDTADDIEEIYETRWSEAREESTDPSAEEVFREFNKELSSFWAGYVNGQVEVLDDDEGLFRLLNTEGHVVRFCEVAFRINREAALFERLKAADDFQRGEESEFWTWVGRSDEEDEYAYVPSDRGSLCVKDRRLLGDTNSKERADQLRERVEEVAGDAVEFETVKVTDLDLSDAGEDRPKRSGKNRRS
jgi:hypothetical protein